MDSMINIDAKALRHKKVNFIVLTAAIYLLTACTGKPEPKTIEHYLANDEERNAVMAMCRNDVGKFKDDKDCINASHAALQARAKHKWIK